MNRFESPKQAVQAWTGIVYRDLDDALLPELAEAIVDSPDIRKAVLEEQRARCGAKEGVLWHPDSTNPKYHPEILDRIEQLKLELGSLTQDQKPRELSKMARDARDIDFHMNLAEVLVFDANIANQILDEDEF